MKLPEKIAATTVGWWHEKVSPAALFLFVLCAFVFFVFQRNLVVLFGMTFLFFVLALTRRGKVKVLPSVFMVLAVTLFSLLSPYGKVLFRVGSSFAITQGALSGGLRRGLVLAGMMFLSQLAISRDLSLPGRLGEFVSRVFVYLDELGKEKLNLRPKMIISSIDEHLLKVFKETD